MDYTTSTGFIISRGAWLLSSATTTSTGNKLWMYSRSAQLHVDTPDTPNWYIKHHNGLEYLNMAISQVTDNPAVVEGSSIHQDAKQQLHQYLRTNIQPLMQTGKPLDLKDIFDHVTIRKSKLVRLLGAKQVQHMVPMLLDQ